MPVVTDTSIPEFGDIIEIDRLGYSHCGIYIGNGEFFHQGLHPNASVLQAIDGKLSNNIPFRVDKIDDVARGSKIYINNMMDKRLRHEKKDILLRLMKHISSPPDGRYNLFTKNCQHACTYFRYDISFSRQADDLSNGIFANMSTGDFTKSRVLVGDMSKHNSTANDKNWKEIKQSFRNQPYRLPTDSPANADDLDFNAIRNITTSNFAGQNFRVSLDLQMSSLPRNMSNICPKNYFSLTEVMSDSAMIAQRPLRKEVCTLINKPYCLPTDSPANADDWDFAAVRNIATSNVAGQNVRVSLDLQMSSLPRNMSYCLPTDSPANAHDWDFAAIRNITTSNVAGQNVRVSLDLQMSSLPRNMSNIYPRNYFSLTEDDNSIITMPDDDMIAQLPLLAEVCTDISEPYCLPTDSPANADDWDFAGLRNITTSNYAGLNFTVQTPSFPRNMSNICPKNYFSLTEVTSDSAMIAQRPLRKEVCTLINEPYFLPRVSLAYKEHFSGLCNNITLDHTGLDRTSRLDYTTNLGNMTCLLPMFSTRNAENGEFSRIYNITTLNYAEQNMTGSSECPRNYRLWNMTEVCPANEFIEEDKKRKSGFAYNMKRTGNAATETNYHDSYFLWMFLIIAPVLIIIIFMFKKIIQTIIQRDLHKITSKRSGRNQVSSL